MGKYHVKTNFISTEIMINMKLIRVPLTSGQFKNSIYGSNQCFIPLLRRRRGCIVYTLSMRPLVGACVRTFNVVVHPLQCNNKTKQEFEDSFNLKKATIQPRMSVCNN